MKSEHGFRIFWARVKTHSSIAKRLNSFYSDPKYYYSLTPFALAIGEWQLASSYDKGYSLLLGLQVGLKYNFKSSQLMMSYESDSAVSGFELDRSISLLQWQYNLQVNHAVRVNYKRTEYDFYNDEDWSMDYNYYF